MVVVAVMCDLFFLSLLCGELGDGLIFPFHCVRLADFSRCGTDRTSRVRIVGLAPPPPSFQVLPSSAFIWSSNELIPSEYSIYYPPTGLRNWQNDCCRKDIKEAYRICAEDTYAVGVRSLRHGDLLALLAYSHRGAYTSVLRARLGPNLIPNMTGKTMNNIQTRDIIRLCQPATVRKTRKHDGLSSHEICLHECSRTGRKDVLSPGQTFK